jgi:hypothetical protein
MEESASGGGFGGCWWWSAVTVKETGMSSWWFGICWRWIAVEETGALLLGDRVGATSRSEERHGFGDY